MGSNVQVLVEVVHGEDSTLATSFLYLIFILIFNYRVLFYYIYYILVKVKEIKSQCPQWLRTLDLLPDM